MSTDALTGVWNRTYIETSVKHEMEMFNRYGHPFSVVFADIDHFKDVNDTYGHAAGDEVIKAFVKEIQSTLRTTDMLGRWGGEEFVVLLPNTGMSSAAIAAERPSMGTCHCAQNCFEAAHVMKPMLLCFEA